MTATEKLRRMLDEQGVEWEQRPQGGWYTTEWTGRYGKCNAMEWKPTLTVMMPNLTPEQAIAATLGDADYERRMDELLCRLTNGKWSKSRSYSVDFMVPCVDEAYEDATLGGGECELVYGEDDEGIDGWWCQSCGGWFAASFGHTGRNNIIEPSYCQQCGKAVKR